MTISKDLFLAILSMDSYNRGYNQGIIGLGGGIGNAVIRTQSDTTNGSAGVSAGFYAIAYDTSAVSGFSEGEKTIAYRGTDQFFPNLTIGGDIWNAYGVGAGSPTGQHATLAIQFYQQVAGNGANLQAFRCT